MFSSFGGFQLAILFFISLAAIILAELLKGLSTNGTPPILQKFSWQVDLAHFMWSHIKLMRISVAIILLFAAWKMPIWQSSVSIFCAIILLALWGFAYWLFNHFWIGKYKFLPLKTPVFVSKAENKIDLNAQVMGVDLDGVQKAYPVSMLFYHHQLADKIGGHSIWVTYCGLCRSGRVYDTSIDGQALDFSLVGAITYNAVFKDTLTGSWWRQETGEAAKGKLAGTVLGDINMEQMSLENWLAKYPNSEILQYDEKFQGKYNFLTNLMNYEASLPGWHRQETPPLIIGLEIGEHAKAYDWEQLKRIRCVMDQLGDSAVLLVSSQDGSSAFGYDRELGGEVLNFEILGDELTDLNTGSKWTIFGQCIEGTLKDSQLPSVQIYQQFLRAWASFHPETSYYKF